MKDKIKIKIAKWFVWSILIISIVVLVFQIIKGSYLFILMIFNIVYYTNMLIKIYKKQKIKSIENLKYLKIILNPKGYCTKCNRLIFKEEIVYTICNMIQPDGNECGGLFVRMDEIKVCHDCGCDLNPDQKQLCDGCESWAIMTNGSNEPTIELD